MPKLALPTPNQSSSQPPVRPHLYSSTSPGSFSFTAWARDEPPSPKEEEFLVVPSNNSLRRRPSDVASYQSSNAGPSRWWSFNRSRFPRPASFDNEALADIKYDLKGNASPSKPWKVPSPVQEFRQPKLLEDTATPADAWGLHISLPPPSPALFATAHNQGPGWDSPWTPRPPLEGFHNRNPYSQMGNSEEEPKPEEPATTWKKRKRILRGYLLTNPYVPLVGHI